MSDVNGRRMSVRVVAAVAVLGLTQALLIVFSQAAAVGQDATCAGVRPHDERPYASDPDDPVERDMAVRRRFGLPSSRAHVEEVQASERSGRLEESSTDLGAVLTKEERAEVATRDSLLSAAGAAYRSYASAHADSSAGIHLDHRTGQVVVLVTREADRAKRHVLETTGMPAARLLVRTVRHAQSELRRAQDVLAAKRDELVARGVRIASTAGNVPTNCLLVVVTPESSADAAAVLADFVPAAMLSVARGEMAQRDGPSGRTAPPLRGGAEVYGHPGGGARSLCTSGFIGYKDINGTRQFYMMWAAHCTYVGDYIDQDGYALGRTDKREWNLDRLNIADAARLPIKAGLATNDVMISNFENRDITSVEPVSGDNDGQTVCLSGVVTYYNCGTLKERSYDWCSDDPVSTKDACFQYGRLASYDRNGGDSGGSVLVGNKALGVHSGHSGWPYYYGRYSHIYDVTRSLEISVVTY